MYSITAQREDALEQTDLHIPASFVLFIDPHLFMPLYAFLFLFCYEY